MTAYLAISTVTSVPVGEGQAVKRIERIGFSSRAYAGGLRSSVRAEKRTWQVTTGLMTDAEINTLIAAVALGAQVTCSGNALGGSVTCEVEVGDDAHINVATTDGLGFLHAVVLTLREV